MLYHSQGVFAVGDKREKNKCMSFIYMEDITRRGEDMSVKTICYKRVQRASKILF